MASNSSRMRAVSPRRYSQPSRHSNPVEARYSSGVACFETAVRLALRPRRNMSSSSGVKSGSSSFSSRNWARADTYLIFSAFSLPGASRWYSTRRWRTSSSSTLSPTKARARGLTSRRSSFWAGVLFSSSIKVLSHPSGQAACASAPETLADIVELIIADQDGVVFLHALVHQGVQDAAFAQLLLEELQALVVVHVAARQDALQPGGVDGPAVGLQPGDGKGAAIRLLLRLFVLGRKDRLRGDVLEPVVDQAGQGLDPLHGGRRNGHE